MAHPPGGMARNRTSESPQGARKRFEERHSVRKLSRKLLAIHGTAGRAQDRENVNVIQFI